MILYLKNGNTLTINNDLKLELLNVDDFVSIIKEASSNVPAPHFKATLKYKLIDNEKEYLGESTFDSYNGIKSTIDEESPYIVELDDWRLSDNTEKYLSFNITSKKKTGKVSDKLSDEAYKLLELPMILFPYGEIQFFNKDEIDEMQKGYRTNPHTGEMYEEWAGDEYVLIGYDATAGVGVDQYIIKTDDLKLPIYWLMTDGGDWKHPVLICDSLDKFSNIIKLLSKYQDDLYDGTLTNEQKNDIYNKICEIVGTNNNTKYWNDLLNYALSDRS
ncbi:MAG: hypothetical protein J6X02_05095 [Bacilli bacterium]|nr:hypothetical protein [Bacilli bacterium]